MTDSISLLNILEEISVGYNKEDPTSEKLKKYIDIIRDALNRVNTNDVYGKPMGFSIRLNEVDFDQYDSKNNLFFQGSYATHTAIKAKNNDIDADIGMTITGTVNDKIRNYIFEQLKSFLPDFEWRLKHPCITVDFLDGFHIDIASYVESGDKLLFINSIDKPADGADLAKPKEFIEYANNIFKSNYTKRRILRLFKYFNKTIAEKLEVEKDNRIPSISLMLYVLENDIEDVSSEEELRSQLSKTIDGFIKFVSVNKTNGPEKPEFHITNTFHNIKEMNDVARVLNLIKANVNSGNYGTLITEQVFNRLNKRSSANKSPSLVGTMG